jgi:hypothetical protein
MLICESTFCIKSTKKCSVFTKNLNRIELISFPNGCLITCRREIGIGNNRISTSNAGEDKALPQAAP